MHDGREESEVGEAKSMTGMGCQGITSSFVSQRGNAMKTMQRFALSAVAAAMLLGLGACSGMSAQGKSTAIGAGVGAVGGAVLTGGSAAGTVGGAAVGGIIGHEVNK
jgi:osmotically inducible lipoprotein OsmB